MSANKEIDGLKAIVVDCENKTFDGINRPASSPQFGTWQPIETAPAAAKVTGGEMTESLIKALANSIECHTHPFEKDPQKIKAAKMMTAVLRASILRNEHGIADKLKSGINKILNEYKEKILYGMDV